MKEYTEKEYIIFPKCPKCGSMNVAINADYYGSTCQCEECNKRFKLEYS